MSSSNNRLCRLIPLHGQRSDLLKRGQLRALKKRPKQLVTQRPAWMNHTLLTHRIEAKRKHEERLAVDRKLAEDAEANRRQQRIAKRKNKSC